MLTLSGSRRLGRFTVFRDVQYEGGRRAWTSRFYALPGEPRLSRDPDGGPSFRFLWFRSPPGAAPPGRAAGMVSLTADLDIPAADLPGLESAIRAGYGLPAGETVQVAPVPFLDGTVQLAFPGSAGEFANRIAGSGPAALTGGQRASFLIELTADGAALLWELLERRLDLFQVRFELVFEHRLDDVRLRLWCDARRSHQALEAAAGGGLAADVQTLPALLRERQLAGVEIETETPLEPERQAALEKTAHDLLRAALASAFLEDGGSSGTKLRPWDAAFEQRLNHTYTESYPARQTAVLDTLIRLDQDPAGLGDRVRRVDLTQSFFNVLQVQIHCTADFNAGLIDTVKITVVYDETGPARRVNRSGEFVFRDGVPPQIFRTELASPNQTSYRYAVEVFYRGSAEPYRFERGPVTGNAVILDLDGLGVLAVDVKLRDAPPDAARAAVVDLRHPASGTARQFILDSGNPAASWRAVVREQPRDYEYKTAWLGASGRRIETDWRTATAAVLWLDAPEELTRKSRVEVISAGDFTGLAQIIVDLRAGAEEEALTFTAPGQSRQWTLPASAGGALEYEVRRTLVFTGGRAMPLDRDWVRESRPVLVAANTLRFEVRLIPRLLDLGGALRMALVELEPESGSGQRKTLIATQRNGELRWSFQMAEPGSHRYRYRVKFVPAQGAVVETPWTTDDREILVLGPPAS